MSDVTAWFPWPARPTRVGWYEYRGVALDVDPPVRYYWTSNQWGYWFGGYWTQVAEDATDEWRGLKEPQI